MAGVTVSFVADPVLAARVKEIARADGVTPSQVAARATALGTLLPASARRTLRFLLTEGDADAKDQLAVLVAKAIAQVGNAVLERQLLARAQAPEPGTDKETEEDLAEQAVRAVAEYHRKQQAADQAAESGASREVAGSAD
jgi:hypothetical protein